MGLHIGLSVDLREDDMKARSSFKKRAGAVPLCNNMAWEDSMKLLSFNKEMLNFDGTWSNLNPNRLGDADNHLGVSMSPEFKPRNPMQRIGRQIQSGIMGAQDQWNDSTLVRGYADTWVPPCGDGAWSVDPTQGGDALKIGENLSRPPTVKSGVAKGAVEPNEGIVSCKAPMPSNLMVGHAAAVVPGILVRGASRSGTANSRRSVTSIGQRGGQTRGSQMGCVTLSGRKSHRKPVIFDRKSVSRQASRREYDARQELFSGRGC